MTVRLRPLRIGVDATPLTQLKTGIGYYIFYYLDELVALKPEYQFHLYAPTWGQDLAYFARYPNVVIHTNAFFAQSHSLWGQSTLAYLLYRDRMDVFWATTQLYPFIKRKKMKVLLTLYDFVYLLYPKTTSFLKCTLQRWLSKSLFRRADYILPISHGTAQRLQEYYKLNHHTVVEPPTKPQLKPMDVSSWSTDHDLRYKEYVLTIGTLEPRKNFEAVLSIFADILSKHDINQILPLVIMGGSGWKNTRLKQQLKNLQIHYPKKVLTLGYISDEKQRHYLAGARYLLLLSHYEGYGMPIAEARSCGTEVLCSDSPEMREAALDQGTFLHKNKFATDLAKFFLRTSFVTHYPSPTYPTNREKSERIAHVLDLISSH